MIQIQLLEEGLCIEGVSYAFRDKATKLYMGYDGFDTDFAKGISPIIQDQDVIAELNKKLLTKTHDEIIDLLTAQTFSSKAWKELGGIAKVDIVRLEIIAEGQVFSPTGLLNLFMSEENNVDYEVQVVI